ncbi:hypothetical protein ACFWBR_19665 [Streptomyces sp. NPDC060006]|uniref:hypothetical protein n=1 Tax=unclassified Streptomyces TaxID=2593676 RepID=UPI003685C22D
MSTKTFEDRLLDELKHEITLRADERPEPAPRRRVTPRRALVTVAACAVAAGVAVALPSATGGSSAYAIERNPDGSVTLTMSESVTSTDQQEKLAEHLRAEGIHVIIGKSGDGFTCAKSHTKGLLPKELYLPHGKGKVKLTFRPGDSLALENPTPPKDGVGSVVTLRMFNGKIPPCKEVRFKVPAELR